MGDSPRIDLHHLGFIGTVELPAEEEFLTNPDVPVFHGLVIHHSDVTLHSTVEIFADPVTELLEGFQLLLPIGITVVGLDLGHQCFVQPVEVYFVEVHCVPHFFGTRSKLSRRYSSM